ncbi:MAG: molybdopterin molybdotransferase MoeA [Bacteroidales bacterium]|nr:molybdopterin molybdotransferase MoeA [Bacteroidales bacterium]MBN2818908.1 molybdopterin molybdotransferase MoeA [Bacteroidales bacterium]
MITYEEALKIINTGNFAFRVIELDIIDSVGFVAAEDLVSDADMPPFNKSAMDGYACRLADLNRELEIIESVSAGSIPQKKITEATCSKIMTGARVPEGADCVIMVEYTEKVNENTVRFTAKNTKSNICLQGEDVKKGDVVIKRGELIHPASVGLAASVGKLKLKVYKAPVIAIITTGDELVEPDQKANEVQIRNSNSYNIQAQLKQIPATVKYLGIVKDNKAEIEKAISKALTDSDILILTGGVSMGDKDYVPEILNSTGLKILFHNMAIQPGKPVAFAAGENKFCFALSGNPVSSLLQFELLVRPFIYKFMGNKYSPRIIKTMLMQDKKREKAERIQFFPVYLDNGTARLIEFHGSAHIAGIHKADGFGIFEIGEFEIQCGNEIRILLIH